MIIAKSWLQILECVNYAKLLYVEYSSTIAIFFFVISMLQLKRNVLKSF